MASPCRWVTRPFHTGMLPSPSTVAFDDLNTVMGVEV